MVLNNESKNYLRNFIEEQLVVEHLNDPTGKKKLKLDKDILEELLFETITINREKGIVIKLPIWSGVFLRHIDLSEVNFEDVSWSELGCKDWGGNLSCGKFAKLFEISTAIEEKIKERIKKIRAAYFEKYNEKDHRVNYSGTNANIDLSKSFEAKNYGAVRIVYCMLADLDLKFAASQDEITIAYSSVRNTGLVIPNNVTLYGGDSDLSGIDLSNREIDAYDNCMLEADESLSGCNLSNTGIKIILSPESFRRGEESRKKLKEAMENNWIGCYVNDVKILTPEEKRRVRELNQKAYETMEREKYIQPIEKIIKEFKYGKK